MTKLAAIFTTSLMVGCSGALMPGLLLTVTISQSAQRGFWQGPLLILGHAIAELALVLALAAGLSRLLKRKAVAGLIGLLGGAFLLWMGLDIARSAWWDTVSLSLVSADYVGHILSDLSWYSLIAFVITAGRSLLSQPVYWGILVVCSLFLIALSIDFIYLGIKFLRGKGEIPDAG